MKYLYIFIVALFCLSLVSASIQDIDYEYKERATYSKYYPNKDEMITITRYSDYSNDKRYSTRDYRNGYTYRETKEYWTENYDKRLDYVKSELSSLKYKDPRFNKRDYDDSSYYYRYSPHLNSYQKIKCYNSPPSGKLFYISCP